MVCIYDSVELSIAQWFIYESVEYNITQRGFYIKRFEYNIAQWIMEPLSFECFMPKRGQF